MHQQHTSRRASGFTLLELMIAVAVLAILLGVAIPSFTDAIRANQIAAQSNSIMSALALARSEAVKRGVRVSACPVASLDPDPAVLPVCTSDWNSEWIVFEDDFGAAGTFDPSDVLIQTWPEVDNGVLIVEVDDESAVTFTRNGRVELERTFTVTKDGCGANQRRDIGIDFSGRVSLARSNCT